MCRNDASDSIIIGVLVAEVGFLGSFSTGTTLDAAEVSMRVVFFMSQVCWIVRGGVPDNIQGPRYNAPHDLIMIWSG